MMNVLILGSGGREHAFAWKLSQSRFLNKLYTCPGNAGTARYGENLSIDVEDWQTLKFKILEMKIDMVIAGSEGPLVAGLADFIADEPLLKNVKFVGPSAEGAKLEGSKDYAKQFMQRHGIPTAAGRTFDKNTLEEGFAFLDSLNPPYVLKADGLAAGKGVLIIDDLTEAKESLRKIIEEQKFGAAGNRVVIEEFLKGRELSVFVLFDGKHYMILPEAKDYKRVGEGDTGLNTGGMGAVSPVPFADRNFMRKVEEQIIKPTVDGLKKENIDYKGFLFIGLMKVDDEPFVIEYNVRMGDPETQVVLPRINNDFLALLMKVCEGNLDEVGLTVNRKTAVTVVATSGGYPGDYQKGKVIKGLEGKDGDLVFHAGTIEKEGQVITNGGRVLAVTCLGSDLAIAVTSCYERLNKIDFDGMYYRRDIGKDLILSGEKI